MKLKTKLFLSVIVVVISMMVIALSFLGMARQQRKANETLTEAKQMLAENLDVQPGELTVYWSGEYMADSQYRYRYHPSSSLADETEYSAYSHSVEPRYDDAVIKDEKVKKLVKKAVSHQYAVNRWENTACFAVLMIIFAIVAIPISAMVSLYDMLTQQKNE